MDRRLWVLGSAGALLAAVVTFRIRQLNEWGSRPAAERPQLRRFAPEFELNDQRSHLVKFQRYLGRTQLVVVFFDDTLGADSDPVLRPLIDHADAIEAAGIQLVGVSAATPFANRQAEERLGHKVDFPLLTDVDLTSPITVPTHRLYGRFDDQTGTPLTGLFLIDRKQTVLMNPRNGFPAPVADPAQAVASLIKGEWPSEQATEAQDR
ncbi:MAG: redoxin domain-containing protein [Planctomycetaceae bacterium]|nr:redoxin domain-containing protein [Planctomycetaceae bacterium]